MDPRRPRGRLLSSPLVRRTALLAAAALAATMSLTTPTADGAVSAGRASTQEPEVTASLWEWNWRSVAKECTDVLGPAGYDGVQVAPPQNSVKRTELGQGSDTVLHPWWEVYQPVSYDLTSRMGTEAQFKKMVTTCRRAGVKVYVDGVINHMTGQGHTSYGGTDYTPYHYEDLYGPEDFHYPKGECPSSDGGVQDYNNKLQVFNCNLSGLEDLDTDTRHVRSELAGYLNKLLGYGVSGFRIDAGKHMAPADLDAIYDRLRPTVDGERPYWALEIGPGSPGVLSPEAYTDHGDVLGLDGVKQIYGAFRSYEGSDRQGDISALATFGSGSGLTRSSKTMSFVTNHDTNHDQANALTYKEGEQYLLATEWLLADGYGSPQVFSSFTFGADANQGPPSDREGIIDRASCANGRWTCDHARTGVAAMVRFHQYVGGAAKRHVYDDEQNVLAFSRGTKGWAGFNNSTSARTITVRTGLKKGTYCDTVTGGEADGGCVGTQVKVDRKGRATVVLPARGAVAFPTTDRL